MENKKSSIFNLFSFFLIIIIAIMGCVIYKFYVDKKEIEEDLTSLNSQINKLQENENAFTEVPNTDIMYKEITEPLDDIDVLYVTKMIDNNDETYTLRGVLYTQYTVSNEELNKLVKRGAMDIEGIVYDIKEESNNEYGLYSKDVDYPVYKFKQKDSNNYYLEAQAQIMDVWKLTEDYREITISKDTKCEMVFDEELYQTIEDVYQVFEESEPIDTTNPRTSNSFTFEFEDGKCVTVINVCTAV